MSIVEHQDSASPSAAGGEESPSAKGKTSHTGSGKSKPQVATKELLTFQLGEEEYGIDILKVQEIRSYEPPTRIAYAPHFIKGVVNLRGIIVPVVDLRVKLGCEKIEYTSATVVIVLKVKGRVVGAVVDSVSDVLELPVDQLGASPEMSSNAVDSAYVTGITNVAGRMLIMMDIESLMLDPAMQLHEEVAA
jgi:purine-binding chemotaxis protein CheW